MFVGAGYQEPDVDLEDYVGLRVLNICRFRNSGHGLRDS